MSHTSDFVRCAARYVGYAIGLVLFRFFFKNVAGLFHSIGFSFGSTIALKALHRQPGRFPRATVQGGFAYRHFAAAERWALRLGRLVPGTVARLPLFRRRHPAVCRARI